MKSTMDAVKIEADCLGHIGDCQFEPVDFGHNTQPQQQ